MRVRNLAVVVGMGVLCIATASHADVFKDKKCVQVKNWLTGVLDGIDQFEGLLADDYFFKHFGKRFLEMTEKEVNGLGSLFGKSYRGYCRSKWAKMTDPQNNLASELLSEKAQRQWEIDHPLDPNWKPNPVAKPASLSDELEVASENGQSENAPKPSPSTTSDKKNGFIDWVKKIKKSAEELK